MKRSAELLSGDFDKAEIHALQHPEGFTELTEYVFLFCGFHI